MEYQEQELLPSENTLTKEYNCARNTLRRALRGLIESGYVQAVHGKGVQVIFRPIEQNTFTIGGIESFAESAARNKRRSKTKVLTFTEFTADKRVSERTGFPEGENVIYIQRVRFLDGKPLILDINMFLKDTVPGLTKEIAAKSIYAYLENELGMQITTSKRRITAERASQIDTANLDLGDYDFVCVITGHTFNSNGVMFEYTQSRHRPDQFCFYDTAVRRKKD